MSRQTFAFARRSLLQGVGLGGASMVLPSILPSMLPSLRRAEAATGIPTRFLIFYTQHGSYPAPWKPTGPGGSGTPTETSFDLGVVHQPLAAHKSDLILLSGVDMTSWADSSLIACGHVNGQVHSLTSAHQLDKTTANGPSIDQYIVNGSKAANGNVSPTRIPSLTLGVAGDNYYGQAAFFSGPGTPVPLESSPQKAFARLFPSGSSTMASDPAALALQRRRTSAMDFAIAQFGAVGNKLGKDERTKLDAHAAAIRDLETRVGQTAAATCTPPAAPPGNKDWSTDADNMIRLIQSGFACDLTRVASLWMGSTPDNLCGYSPGMLGTTDSHDMIHKVDGGDLANDPSAVNVITQFHVQYAKVFAKVLDALKAIPESDGKTLLDHTVVLWASELAEGGHGCANLKWVLAGNANGYFKTGRYLSWGDYDRCEYCADKTMPSHADLFVSIANAVGVPTTTFGDAAYCHGPIANLRA